MSVSDFTNRLMALGSLALLVLVIGNEASSRGALFTSGGIGGQNPGCAGKLSTALLVEKSGNSPSLERAASLMDAPLGALGPNGTRRANLRYYDSLFYMSLQYGATASSVLEVGCGKDAFVRNLNWIPDQTCVAPYFASYSGQKANGTADNNNKELVMVQADFLKWKAPRRYDLVLCGQVLEHVKNPRRFLRKLLRTAQQATVVSVPFRWRPCGRKCGHVSHLIDETTVAKWAAPAKPEYFGVVKERNGAGRLIAVFAAEDKKG